MDEWEEQRVVEALRAIFRIPEHWHFDLIKLRQANAVLRNIAREGDLILRGDKSHDYGEYTVLYKRVYVRFLSGNEYFVANIALTDDDYEHLPKHVIVEEEVVKEWI